MSERSDWDDAWSAIELDIGGVRAILLNPPTPPYGERFDLWVCNNLATKVRLEQVTEDCFEEFIVPYLGTKIPDWAIMVGRAVAPRMNATIVREKHFDPSRVPKRNLTPEELSDIEF